ncbi:MAG: PaaI family thioesterase [Hyphomonas sp.]|nr:PaaI family thioesterase [Hyphomonas sp.]
MTDPAPPEGYAPHFRKSAFTDPWEPLYSKVTPEQVSIGLFLREAHCNSRGLVHGGLIASIADNAMGLSCGEVLRGGGRTDVSGLVTVSLTTDYVGSAGLGQWLATDTYFTRAGGSLAFASCLVQANSHVVARANASFKILTKRADG